MGIAQAGLAFRPKNEIKDFKSFIEKVFERAAVEIDHPDVGQFDIRRANDVMVQVFGRTVFICSNALVWQHLEYPQSDLSDLHERLGLPDAFTMFCNYESGDSYGYAFVSSGVRTRSRLQLSGSNGERKLIEYGDPTARESRWLAAPSYLEEDDCPPQDRQRIFYLEDPKVEVTEHCLTQYLLNEALIANFGVCPWDTNEEPVHHFFRLSVKGAAADPIAQETDAQPSGKNTAQIKSAWWKFWA
jgi:hypothetical protein